MTARSEDRGVQVEARTLWHRPQPGPSYWDWRCLRCSHPVADHPSWWARLKRRLADR